MNNYGENELAKFSPEVIAAVEDYLSLWPLGGGSDWFQMMQMEFGMTPYQLGLLMGTKMRRAEQAGEKYPCFG